MRPLFVEAAEAVEAAEDAEGEEPESWGHCPVPASAPGPVPGPEPVAPFRGGAVAGMGGGDMEPV